MNTTDNNKETYTLLEGLIVKIQRYSIHDGPGIRTTVFFKGCPLRCHWCSSPETYHGYPEIGFYEDTCIAECSECVTVCPAGALTMSGTSIQLDRMKCNRCGECAKICPSEALTSIGYYITPDKLMDEIRRDRQFYDTSGGGVTLSGGEPFNQYLFTKEIAKRCKEEGISVTLDTCGYAKKEQIKDIIKYVDLILFDLKHMDSSEHYVYTGAPNDCILENAAIISERGIPVIMRFPLIPGVNDSRKNLEALAKYVKTLDSVKQLDILPYHPLGIFKYRVLGKICELQDIEMPTKNYLIEIREFLESYGLKVSIVI